jgi:prophage antirepressor-like protein
VNTELVPFAFDGHEVRTVRFGGEPWFVVVDICSILDLGNPSMAIKGLQKPDLSKVEVSSSTQGRKMLVVNEPGLYRLIFRSKKGEAEKFQDWICREVIPSIRKTGQFTLTTSFVLPAPKAHQVIFPPEFFHHLFRLMNRPEVPPHKARWIAQKIIDLIWRRIEEGVFDAIKLVNPTVPAKSSGKLYRRYKLSQFVAEGQPTEKLITFVARCTQAMSDFSKWQTFYSQWDAQHPIKRDLPHEVRVTFADDSEMLFTFMFEK